MSEALIKDSYFISYVFPILDKNQEVQGVAGIVIDINEKKQKQLELIHFLSQSSTKTKFPYTLAIIKHFQITLKIYINTIC